MQGNSKLLGKKAKILITVIDLLWIELSVEEMSEEIRYMCRWGVWMTRCTFPPLEQGYPATPKPLRAKGCPGQCSTICSWAFEMGNSKHSSRSQDCEFHAFHMIAQQRHFSSKNGVDIFSIPDLFHRGNPFHNSLADILHDQKTLLQISRPGKCTAHLWQQFLLFWRKKPLWRYWIISKKIPLFTFHWFP